MALWDKAKRQLRSVIEWTNPGPDDLIIKWAEDGDEIKNASKLIVGPGQGCIFVYEGRVQAVYEEEGIVELASANVPFWTTISKFMQAFKSEHKVGLYFFKRTKILDQKWGTTSPVKYDDPKYKFPVGLKAHGNFSFRLINAEAVFSTISGSNAAFKVSDFRAMMTARMIQPLTDYLAESKHSYAEIDANREEIAAGVEIKLIQEFKLLGFEIIDFKIEGTNFDEDTMRRINRIADMTAEAQAAQAAGLSYAQMQQLDALKAAAANPGGTASIGVGMGAGMGFGQMMAGMMQGQQQQSAQPPVQPLAAAKQDPMEKLASLKKMMDAGLISPAEFEQKKKEILLSM